MRKTISRLALAAIAAPLCVILAAVMAGCSSEQADGRLLRATPSDILGICFYNVDRLASDGVPADILSQAAWVGGPSVYADVMLADHTRIRLSEAPSADSIAAAGFTPDGRADGSLTPYAGPEGRALVVDTEAGIAYGSDILSPARVAETAKAMADAAAKSSFASRKGLAEIVTANSSQAISGLMSVKAFGSGESAKKGDAGTWLSFTVEQESDVASLAISPLTADGEPSPVKGLRTIDTDFLRYTAPDMNIVAAVGLTPAIDWNAAAALLAIVTDRQTASYIDIAVPYLKAIDGTVAVALAQDPAAPDEITPATRFFVMAHMEQAKAEELLKQASMLASLSGADMTDAGQGIERISHRDLATPIFTGFVDGNFVLSSSLPDGRSQNSYNTSFEGHDAAAIASFAPGQLPASVLPTAYGLDARITVDDDVMRLRLSFPGADMSPLAVVASRLFR